MLNFIRNSGNLIQHQLLAGQAPPLGAGPFFHFHVLLTHICSFCDSMLCLLMVDDTVKLYLQNEIDIDLTFFTCQCKQCRGTKKYTNLVMRQDLIYHHMGALLCLDTQAHQRSEITYQ